MPILQEVIIRLSYNDELQDCIAKKVVSSLYELLISTNNSHVENLFNLWLTMFTEAHGDLQGQRGVNAEDIGNMFGISDSDHLSLYKLIFAMETYYSIVLKLIALQEVSFAGGRLSDGNIISWLEDNEMLRTQLNLLETGETYRRAGISNFTGDCFGWYLELLTDDFIQQIKRVISEIGAGYIIDHNGGWVYERDLLRSLFHSIFPSNLRHSMGEYYTPDWLSEQVLERVGFHQKIKSNNLRSIDPACGSGTFLINILKSILTNGGTPPTEVSVRSLLDSVCGFDINPIAVLTSKTNLLLAVCQFLLHETPSKDLIELPIYLCDSLMVPHRKMKEESLLYGYDSSYETSIAGHEFRVPKSIVTSGKIDKYFAILWNTIKSMDSFENALEELQRTLGKTVDDWDYVKQETSVLFRQLTRITDNGKIPVWISLVKERFKPLTIGCFDVVVTNPPWVGWEYIPSDYKELTKHLWPKYGLFSERGTKMAFSKEDISSLMTYVFIDRYLCDDGIMGVVIRQAVLKSVLAGKGFRRFKIGENGPNIKIITVDDLSDLQPFEGASNRTAILVMKKGEATEYPVPYYVWRKGKAKRRIPPDSSLNHVLERTERLSFVGFPSKPDEPTSLWITGPLEAITVLQYVSGSSYYRARSGVFTGGANAVYWVDVLNQNSNGTVTISNITKGAKRKVPKVTRIIEKDLIFPLVRGRDLKRWFCKPSAYIICPHTKDTKMKAIPTDVMKKHYPLTYEYLKEFRQALDARRGFTGWERQYQEANFYAIQRIGEYTFKEYKVAWRYIASDFICSVVPPSDVSFPEIKPMLPHEKLMLIGCESSDEAFYLCGLLSSLPFRYAVRSKMVSTQIAPSIINDLDIGKFNPNNHLHQKIIQLCKKGHELTRLEQTSELQRLNRELDFAVAELVGLNDSQIDILRTALENL